MASPGLSQRNPRSLVDCLQQIGRLAELRRAMMDPSQRRELKTPQGVELALPLKDAIALFDELQIPYALIGGIAAMAYGRLRATEDIDFVAATGHMDKLAANPDVMRRHHFDPASAWKLYHDSGVEIDIRKDQFSDQISQRAYTIEFAGQSLKIADPHDLIAMKLRANRIQDDYDVSEIIKNVPVDTARLQGLVTAEEFKHFESIKARSQA